MRLLLITFFYAGLVGAASNWEGEWPSSRGELDLSKCKNDTCEFSLNSVNGSYTCDLEGKAKVTETEIILTKTILT